MNEMKFRRTDLRFVVDYDYERSSCTCNGDICRCTRIYNAHVESFNTAKVIENLYKAHKRTMNPFDQYCFDRICYALKIYDKNLYEVETGGGYYGEEVYGVYFENEEAVFNAYCEVLKLESNIEKIKYCLNLEYGYLIDSIKNATEAAMLKVSPDDVYLPQREYYVKVDMDVIDDYKNRSLPVAVCVDRCDRYDLIDGYHRYVANKDANQIQIIVLSE